MHILFDPHKITFMSDVKLLLILRLLLESRISVHNLDFFYIYVYIAKIFHLLHAL